MNIKFGKKDSETPKSINEKFLSKYLVEEDVGEQPEHSKYCLLPKEEEICNGATD